jgi:hypothetical protein
LLLDHGDGHVIITLRTIVESSGNERALTAAGIQGVSDLVLAHPSWPDHGLAWIEAFDNIDLIELAKMAKANCKAVPKREAWLRCYTSAWRPSSIRRESYESTSERRRDKRIGRRRLLEREKLASCLEAK